MAVEVAVTVAMAAVASSGHWTQKRVVFPSAIANGKHAARSSTCVWVTKELMTLSGLELTAPGHPAGKSLLVHPPG